MIKQSNSPYGYKKLLVYKKAEELQLACAELTSHFPHSPRYKTLLALADQMDCSARSVKQNIVEGWKRNSTKEYYDFLGFSLGANAELEEDCDDIIKGVYRELKGIMGEKGKEGEKGEGTGARVFGGVVGRKGGEWTIDEVEKLPFYPLNPHLPPLIQLKLRGKELNMLLEKLQSSLLEKMSHEHTLPQREVLARVRKSEAEKDRMLEQTIKDGGFVRLPNGQIVKKTDDKR